MTFSYSDYHFHCMVIPLITLFLTGAIFAGGAYKAVKDIARKGATVEKVLTLLMCESESSKFEPSGPLFRL